MNDHEKLIREAVASGESFSDNDLRALQGQPAAVSDAEINRIVYEHTKLNPNQADDVELLTYIRNAVRAIIALRPQADHPDSYEDIWQALMDINSAVVMLPEFEVRTEGGIKAFTHNIVEAINAAALRPQAVVAKAQVPMTEDNAEALIEDLASWASYVDVDHAFQTLDMHVRQTLESHGITAPAGGEKQA